MSIFGQAANRLKTLKKSLSTAESCTGGLVAHRLTNIPGSSDFFKGGMIAYSNQAKQRLLRIPETVLKKHGAVSAPVARLMAQNVRKVFQTNFGIGITGIAGPSGGTRRKPVGLVHIAAASRRRIKHRKFLFSGTRLQIKRQAADQAVQLLLNLLQ